ncbi:DUF2971 domain-containing protein [Caulobacter sp. KR2-114]|uniref:DUF2971 domain-containing protein n=1 Tax=Caulobacter sp. KR2-114 TaxID=3400912 RepID=UPI003C0848D6
MNDVAELMHFARLLNDVVRLRLSKDDVLGQIEKQLENWLSQRFQDGHLIFAASFTENGDLLSQWRGYCPPGQGVSLGFNPSRILQATSAQSFLLGRCIYAVREQLEIAYETANAVIAAAREAGPSPKRHAKQSYYDSFEEFLPAILTVAALMKNPAFSEEQEWRIVSPPLSNYVLPPIQYRAGASMLVPYLEFGLPKHQDGRVEMAQLCVGPTPTMNLSVRSMAMFLSRQAACSSTRSSQVPYRA